MTRIPTNIKDIQIQKLEVPARFVDCDYMEPAHHHKRFISSMLLNANVFDSNSDWEVHTIIAMVNLDDVFIAVVDVYSESERESKFVFCWWTSFLDFDFTLISAVRDRDEALIRCGFPEDIYNDPVPIFMTENEIWAWNAFALKGRQLQDAHKNQANK